MRAGKLMLTVLCGGTLLGVLAGAAVNPTMQPPPEPSWRKVEPDVIFTSAGQRFYEAAPEDLDPPGWFDYARPGFTERFAGFAPRREPIAVYAPEPYEPAEAYPRDRAADEATVRDAASPAAAAARAAMAVREALAAEGEPSAPDEETLPDARDAVGILERLEAPPRPGREPA